MVMILESRKRETLRSEPLATALVSEVDKEVLGNTSGLPRRSYLGISESLGVRAYLAAAVVREAAIVILFYTGSLVRAGGSLGHHTTALILHGYTASINSVLQFLP